MKRVCAYIDGFNLYHAIDDLHDHRLKWVNLHSLMQVFLDPNVHKLESVYYFSAYADWLKGAHMRHTAYVAALQTVGVTPIMGNFKKKERSCKKCLTTWTGHEEKETDVNIALSLLDDAYRDRYDVAMIVSRDSDLVPALKLVKARFPEKVLKVITPPNQRHSKEMAKIVGDKRLAEIRPVHLQRNQLPDKILNTNGDVICLKPEKYNHQGPSLQAVNATAKHSKRN